MLKATKTKKKLKTIQTTQRKRIKYKPNNSLKNILSVESHENHIQPPGPKNHPLLSRITRKDNQYRRRRGQKRNPSENIKNGEFAQNNNDFPQNNSNR